MGNTACAPVNGSNNGDSWCAPRTDQQTMQTIQNKSTYNNTDTDKDEIPTFHRPKSILDINADDMKHTRSISKIEERVLDIFTNQVSHVSPNPSLYLTDDKQTLIPSNIEADLSTPENVINFYRNDYYGQNTYLISVFNYDYALPILYCDWTASGKCLKSIETYIISKILPYYANTHTATSITGKQTTLFREEARRLILTSPSVNGNINDDVVLFVGNGVTGAIFKLANILMKCDGFTPQNTVVMVGIYEHNSNILIWKELGVKLIVIPESSIDRDDNDVKYGINTDILEENLKKYTSGKNAQKYNLIIGSFTGASNISGIIEKHDEITRLLHNYGALSFWDYATAGPYLDLKMSDKNDSMLSKDAIFISLHKFLGGPGTPGLLICKRNLCNNPIPVIPGGGTVNFAIGATEDLYTYHPSITEREEGGTPNIIGSIRAALTIMAKDKIGVEVIESIEERYIHRFFEMFQQEYINTGIMKIIGNIKCPRLPIISFNILYGNKWLHYNYIAALFNDLFGINGRGGCSCAGMYGVDMLKKHDVIYNDVAHMREQLAVDNELARFGYFRINFHYTLSEKEFEYVLKCLKYICDNGWKFLALYDIDIKSGLYVHRSQMKISPNEQNNGDNKHVYASLQDIYWENVTKSRGYGPGGNKQVEKLDTFDKIFEFAENILKNMKDYLPTREEINNEEDTGDNKRFYWLPSELYDEIRRDVAGLSD